MAWSRPLLLAALLALLVPVAGADAVPPPEQRAVRVVLYPVKLAGERVPGRPRLERALRELSAFMERVTYGRILVTGEVAPPFRATTRSTRDSIIPFATLDAAVSSAAARGVRTDGGIPLFIAPSRRDKRSFANSSFAVIQGRGLSRPEATVAHELAHVLGLDHAGSPRACPRPFRPVACSARPRVVDQYGDGLDVMGTGRDRFGAYHLAVLGAAPVRDAPTGSARVTVRPLQDRRPTLLRLRTASEDWFVESRTRASSRYSRRAVRLPAGVGVSRVRPQYAPDAEGRVMAPLRVPGAAPASRCTSDASCLARQLFRPGATLTVPGAVRLRVLGRGPRGSTRVRTTWLDRTPPALSVAGATIVRRFGGGAELALEVRAAAAGAGVAAVLIDQGGALTRIDPDTVPGLVAGARGAGLVRAPLAPGAAAATVRLVDAAGNASAPAVVDLAGAPSAAAATVAFDPPLGPYEARATPVAAGRAVTVSGVTDPSLEGLTWRLDVIGTQVSADLPIGPGGALSGSWTPTEPGLYKVVAQVPVERIPGSFELRRQTVEGWVRA